jgi:hypothetical protein
LFDLTLLVCLSLNRCHPQQAINDAFDELNDFVAFARRPGQYVPPRVDDIIRPADHAKKAKAMFYEMKRETDRKRLAADVEIKVSDCGEVSMTDLTLSTVH